jgi:CheY-like chemotaxis protein
MKTRTGSRQGRLAERSTAKKSAVGASATRLRLGSDPLPRRGAARPVVLVLEDDRDLRGALTEVLYEGGYEAYGFEHGQEALGYLKDAPPPSAILLDLMMPVMDGWKFFSALKGEPALANVPVVVMSTGDRLGSAPVSSAYLEKPISRDRLLEAMARSSHH